MGRSIIAEAFIETYLEKLSKLQKISIGLIIGQPTQQGKEFVVHLARTAEHQADDTKTQDKPTETVIDLDNHSVANHSLNVIRILSGGFNILGVFVVSPTNLYDDVSAFQKIKMILLDIRNLLKSNHLLYGICDEINNGEMLVLHYSSTLGRSICKSIELKDSSKSMMSKPVEWHYQDKITDWTMIESYYELDEVFPLLKKDQDHNINLEDNFLKSLDVISKQITNSIVFFDGEPLEKFETLESISKSRNIKDNKIMQATIYFPCVESEHDNAKIIKYHGTVQYNGIISSRVWAHPKNTITEIENYVKTDIIRSLASRIQIHCDALLESDFIDSVIVNEPPRRVYYPIKSSQVQFSDYIFRGEGDETIIRQAKELLDIDLPNIDIISDVETLPEIEENIVKQNDNTSAVETTKLMYFLGILTAIFVLIISIVIHFMFKG